MNKKNTIVFASDDGYVQHLCVAMFSLVKNYNDNQNLFIKILDGGISDINKEKIVDCCSRYNCNISFISVDLLKFYSFVTSSYNEFAYARLLIHELFQEDVVLYLDSDIVVVKDISGLFNTDLSQNPIAACSCEYNLTADQLKDFTHIGHKQPYFNSGVILLNLQFLRNINFTEKSIIYLDKYKDCLKFADQDLLNHFFADSRLLLHPRYNCTNSLLYAHYYQDTVYDELTFNDARDHPSIIHFAGGSRPRDGTCFHKGNKEYRNYLLETPFAKYKIPLHKLFSSYRIKMMIAFFVQRCVVYLPYAHYSWFLKVWRKYLL